MSFAKAERLLVIFLAIACYIFSIIDSLFFGYYLWLYFGAQFFLLYFFCSVPFVFINRANNYVYIYDEILKNHPDYDENDPKKCYEGLSLWEAISSIVRHKLENSSWYTAAQLAFFLILGYFTYNLYIVYYGSWVIQVLKILRNKMGFSGMEWIRILVLISLIPESLAFCVGMFGNIKHFASSIYKEFKNIGKDYNKKIIKNLSYCIMTIIAIAGAIVSAQIAASYIVLTYQHYLMEFYKVSVPTVRNKLAILAMLFLDIFFTIKDFLVSIWREYDESDLIKLKSNYYSYILLCCTMFLRAISKIVLAVGIATSPWHVNIKVSTFLQSMFDDLLSLTSSHDHYEKEIVSLAVFFSLLSLCIYILLVCLGYAKVSLAYKIISISFALILAFAVPNAINNVNAKNNSDESIISNNYTLAVSLTENLSGFYKMTIDPRKEEAESSLNAKEVLYVR